MNLRNRSRRPRVLLLPVLLVLLLGTGMGREEPQTSGSVASISGAAQIDEGTWAPAASMSLAHCCWFHTATLLQKGYVLVVGGGGSSDGFGSAELYDPISDSWAWAGPLAHYRSSHTATLLQNGYVLVVGGADNIASAELYDPVTNSWSPAASISTDGTVRYGNTATLLPSGKVLVAGGGIDPSPAALASAELYDPATDGWSPAAPMHSARFLHTATLLPGGKVLAVGGRADSILASAELYDPATNSWSDAASMNVPRFEHSATLLPSGKVLVTGGYNDGQTAEIYDPATNTWSPAANMHASRREHAAVLLPFGKVLVTGGAETFFTYDPATNSWSYVRLSSAEVYDPTTDTWTSVPDMSSRRYAATGTWLPSVGRALVVGGFDGTNVVATAELFTPPLTDTTPPLITPDVQGKLGQNGWHTGDVTVKWDVTDPESPITSSPGCDTTTITADTPGTTITCTATSQGGTSSLSVTIKRDATSPTIICAASPDALWPPNNKLISVTTTIDVRDSGSGSLGLLLTSLAVNEGNLASDIQDWTIGEPDTSGLLRAERFGSGSGRIYELGYEGKDNAGNTAACAATVTVPHDEGH